jgi:hypothetical protein
VHARLAAIARRTHRDSPHDMATGHSTRSRRLACTAAWLWPCFETRSHASARKLEAARMRDVATTVRASVHQQTARLQHRTILARLLVMRRARTAALTTLRRGLCDASGLRLTDAGNAASAMLGTVLVRRPAACSLSLLSLRVSLARRAAVVSLARRAMRTGCETWRWRRARTCRGCHRVG